MTNNIRMRALAVAGVALSTMVSVSQAVAQAPAPTDAAPVAKSWTDKFTLGADFRLRTEQAFQEAAAGTVPTDAATRIRNRVQARATVTGKVNEDVNAVIRLASGTAGDTVASSNRDLGDASSKKEIYLDLAYFDWKVCKDSSFLGGKTPNPFWTPGKSQLVWDSDLTFEGAALKMTHEMDALKLMFNAGGSWLKEQKTKGATKDDRDLFLSGAQLAAAYKTDDLNATVSVAYYAAPVKSELLLGTGAKGNTSYGAGAAARYNDDFKLLNAGAEVGGTLGVPVAVYVDWVQNSEPNDENSGMLYGLRVGKLGEPRSWSVDYNYRTLEQDAVLGTFTDADLGGTNIRGHRGSVQYQAAPGAVIGLTYFGAENNVKAAPLRYEKTQLDFMFSI